MYKANHWLYISKHFNFSRVELLLREKITSNIERSSKSKNHLLNRRFMAIQLLARNTQMPPPYPLSSPSPSKGFLLVSSVDTLSHFGVPRTAWTMIHTGNRSQLDEICLFVHSKRLLSFTYQLTKISTVEALTVCNDCSCHFQNVWENVWTRSDTESVRF